MGRKQDINRLDDGPFAYIDGILCIDGLPLSKIAAEVGTPAYVYSAGTVSANYLRIAEAFSSIPGTTVHYAVKANGNLALLRLLAQLDASFDVVSGGELTRVLRAGGEAERIVFAGVGKTQAELSLAVREGVTVHVESADELDALQAMTEYATGKARVTLRVNPDVEVDTHHHIRTGHDEAKFGIPVEQAKELLGRMANGDYPGLEPVGVHVHVGSQLPDPDGMVAAARVALEVIESGREAGLKLTKLDVGGGLPLDYEGGEATPPEDFAAALAPVVEGKEVELQLEPDRAIVGRAGALVTQVLYRKHRSAGRMLVVDTGMQHLMRPALYEAKHRFVALEAGEAAGPTELVGPVCESTDVLGVSDTLPDLEPGDLIAILDAGAYGMTMASNYNSHPRPPEIVVEGGIARVTRRRETWEEQLAWETTGGDQGTVLPTRAMRQQMRVDDTAEFKAVDTADLERLGMPKH